MYIEGHLNFGNLYKKNVQRHLSIGITLGTRRWQYRRSGSSVADTSVHLSANKTEALDVSIKLQKLNSNEIKRLFTLAKPERWTLACK